MFSSYLNCAFFEASNFGVGAIPDSSLSEFEVVKVMKSAPWAEIVPKKGTSRSREEVGASWESFSKYFLRR